MCFVGTTSGITSVIDGDKIIYDGELGNYIVKDGQSVIGIFDISAIEYLYLARPKEDKRQ